MNNKISPIPESYPFLHIDVPYKADDFNKNHFDDLIQKEANSRGKNTRFVGETPFNVCDDSGRVVSGWTYTYELLERVE